MSFLSSFWRNSSSNDNQQDDASKQSAQSSTTAEKIVARSSLAVAKTEARVLDPREDYLAYKVVKWCTRRDGGDVAGVQALLHMQIPGKTGRIYESGSGRRARLHPARDQYLDKTKYCTNELLVIGVQFFGSPELVLEALIDYQQDKGFLLSGFSGGNRYRYELGARHLEPKAGLPGCGCVNGLHFFRDIQSALDYSPLPRKNNRNDDNDCWLGNQPIVAKRLMNGRGFVTAIDNINYGVFSKKGFPVELDKGLDENVLLNKQKYAWPNRTTRIISFVHDVLVNHRQHRRTSFAKLREISDDNDSLLRSVDSSNDDSFLRSVDSSDNDSLRRSVDSSDNEAEECPICLHRDDNGGENTMIALQCHPTHRFHEQCLFGIITCPICRSPINDGDKNKNGSERKSQ